MLGTSMFDRLALTLNAQFYRARRDALTDHDIRSILDAAVPGDEGAPSPIIADEFRHKRQTPTGHSYRASLRIFLTERPVYFLTKFADEDSVHAYILLLEFDEHVAIFKKSCADISQAVGRSLNPISYNDSIATINDAKVAYQKLSARQMTVAETAIRVRSYEAADLKGSLSPFFAGRSVVRSLRLRRGNRIQTMNLATGRFVDAAERQGIDQVAEWAATRLASERNRDTAFISTFARSVELVEALKNARPNAVLIDAGALAERLEHYPMGYTKRDGVIVVLPERMLSAVLRALERVYEIDEDHRIVGVSARLRINKSTLTFFSRALARLRLYEDAHWITLQRFIISNNLYTITFTEPKFAYTAGTCFEDQSGIAEIPTIKALFEPLQSLCGATSEKGDIAGDSQSFSDSSVFALVEARHHVDDVLICDDLGDEWADHIALNATEFSITFIHSKHGDESTSASKLHDVVGQAIKNLGNMTFDIDRFMARYRDKWSANYVNSKIRRLRRGDGRRVHAQVKSILESPKLHKKCVIACSFISKRAMTQTLNRVERRERVPGHVYQLLWILSSYAHAVRDAGAFPVIYCKP
jgi:hypothetical protein